MYNKNLSQSIWTRNLFSKHTIKDLGDHKSQKYKLKLFHHTVFDMDLPLPYASDVKELEPAAMPMTFKPFPSPTYYELKEHMTRRTYLR